MSPDGADRPDRRNSLRHWWRIRARHRPYRPFDQGVDGVAHPVVGNQDPSAAIDFFGQIASETVKVAVVVKELPASIAPREH